MEYRVKLPEFSGPLDLLLHLVKKQEVDIHEISIARILTDFLAYLRALETLDLHNIGDFVVMATTLMEIKSKELLPRETVDLRAELDPRDELIRQLLEYRRYRDLMRQLERQGKDREQLIGRGSSGADPDKIRELVNDKFEQEVEASLDLEDLDAWFLLKAYAKLLEETDFGKSVAIEGEKKSIAVFIEELVGRLEAADGKELRFEQAFDAREGKSGLIGIFTALLELLKQQRITARQERPFGTIVLALLEAPADAPAEDAPAEDTVSP